MAVVPTVFTHGLVALVAGGSCAPRRLPFRFWVLSVFCSAAPDLDVLSFRFGVQYGDFWGHRGFTHSLAFALGLAIVVVTLAFRREAPFPRRRWLALVAFFFLLTASHGVFDAFTDGGLGVAFFSPFDRGRYFMPWTPISVSPIGAKAFFSARGASVMVSEAIWVWGPVLVAGLGVWLVRRKAR